MMKKLLQRIRLDAAMELKEAEKNHGPVFASMHECWGVIAEEMQEAKEEWRLCGFLQGCVETCIRGADRGGLEDYLKELEEHALLAACEMVQVAAMARKGLKTARGEQRNGR